MSNTFTRYFPTSKGETGFAFSSPVLRSGARGVRGVRAMRTIVALVALVIIVVPQKSSYSASFESASPMTEKFGKAGKTELIPALAGRLPVMETALPFVAAYSDAASPLRAEDCLTEAIYYEGALEPDLGQHAIAQVVLNRVRHPQYPNSVCGVVFQGQHLSTSCQFTFTCDGSRMRTPMPSLWRKANLVAKAALGGAVMKGVGLATHYHADYVQPYWSPTLDKTGQIGRHIFYRWRGRAGQPGAFSSTYAGREPLIEAWVARAEDTNAPLTMLGQEVLTVEGFAPMPGTEALPPALAPPPFKARPLRLAPIEIQPQ